VSASSIEVGAIDESGVEEARVRIVWAGVKIVAIIFVLRSESTGGG